MVLRGVIRNRSCSSHLTNKKRRISPALFQLTPPETVVSQNPPADATQAVSPKVDLILSAGDNSQQFIMPNFVGVSLETAVASLKKAGFVPGKIHPTSEDAESSSAPGTILRQLPPAGQRIAAGTLAKTERVSK